MPPPKKRRVSSAGEKIRESLLRRKYVIPVHCWLASFLACNQATGVNSIIGYNPTILFQAGLSGSLQSHWGYVVAHDREFSCFTIIGVMLVDKKGRKFLLLLPGSAGIIVSLLGAGLLFSQRGKIQGGCEGRRIPSHGRRRPETFAAVR